MKRRAAALFVLGLLCLAQSRAQIPNAPLVGFTGASNGIGGNDSCTKILLTTDGANGGASFPDSNAGGSAHTWTATSATTSTTSPKFGTANFLGAPGRITTPDSSDFTLSSTDMTFDLWVNRSGTTGARALGGQVNSTGDTHLSSVGFALTATNKPIWLLALSTGFVTTTGVTSITGSSWIHLAFIRSGTALYLAVNGVLDATNTASGAITDSAALWGVGRMGSYTGYPDYNAGLDEVRLSVGASCGARWTSFPFTPPTSPYTVP